VKKPAPLPILLISLLVPVSSAAHDISSVEGLPGWSLEPWILVPLGLTLVLFTRGWMRLRIRSSAGRRSLDDRACRFFAGWAVLAGALLSPLHAMGERSFAAHMAEHELLMLAAAPLLAAARPLAIMLWAFGPRVRQKLGAAIAHAFVKTVWRTVSGPVFATGFQATVLWIWHAPALFDRALSSEIWHAFQHLSFVIAGLLFWSAMFARGTPSGTAVFCLFATSVVSGALGALMAFSASPWYSRYAELGMAPFALTPQQDQQFAGLLMWVPGGMVHAGAALFLLFRMLRDEGSAHAC